MTDKSRTTAKRQERVAKTFAARQRAHAKRQEQARKLAARLFSAFKAEG